MNTVTTVLMFGSLAVVALLLFLVWRRLSASGYVAALMARLDTLEKLQERLERAVREELARNRDETAGQASTGREELRGTLKQVSDSLVRSVGEISTAQKQQLESMTGRLDSLTRANEQKLEAVRAIVEQRLQKIQEENSAKLDQMRQTVDEKLHGTLEKRLGESFKQVSDRLEQVHRGLGEMQTLAGGVGDLKRLLTNVKLRGGWGEVQLGALLDQMLTPDQYDRNVATNPDSREQVEFAIRLPGRDGSRESVVWLPIDAKFPREDYERLQAAQDRADEEGVKAASKDLETQFKKCARDIREKYLNPPKTTDFGIMFLPTEGLFAELIRRPGLVDTLQREFRVVVAGPTTLAALLNSLQMGFRTLAIQQRSGEVWQLLGAVKTEFGKFTETLTAVQTKLGQASSTLDEAARRTKRIEQKLRDVQQIAAPEAQALPAVPPGNDSQPGGQP